MAFYVPRYLDIIDESELLTVLQEVQFENPKLKQMESLIHDLREKYMSGIGITRINTDPLVKEIATLFEQIFGFYSFQFSVDQSKFPNAYTAAISSKIDAWNYRKCVVRDNQGIRFTPQAKVNTMAVITTGLLLDSKYTDREIVAILLHEIGHNFSDSVNGTLGVFSNFKKVLLIPSILINPQHVSNNIRQTATKYNDYMRKNNPQLVSAFNAVKLFIGELNYVVLSVSRLMSVIPNVAISNLVNTLKDVAIQIIRNPVWMMNIVFNFFGKEDEYTSDAFVAMYGYAADLSSGLLKIERHNPTAVDEVFKSSEFGASWFAFFVESTDLIRQLLSDNHPSTANRLLNVLDILEKEYNKDYINPKFKKETKKEIDEIRQLIKDEMENQSFDGNRWRVAWNKHIFATKPDKKPKDKMIDDMLDKIEGFEEY